MIIINKLKKIIKEIRIANNKIGSKKRAKKLKENFTLISNNCWGGLTYEYLNQEFLSPTIGLYFMAKEYLKFISNIRHYLEIEITFIPTTSSKYYNYLKTINQKDALIGVIDDVEIVFLHYKNEKEAHDKWERRKKKVNYNRIVYKFNDQNLCTEDELDAFNKIKLDNKICFTAKKYEYPGFIQLKKYKKNEHVKDDAYSYHKYFDIIDYLNNI